MTIPLDEFMARSLADPEVKREYDALAPEFEALAKSIRARKSAAKRRLPHAARSVRTKGNSNSMRS
jgi:hypothetical protein